MDIPIRAAETVELADDTHHVRFLAGEGIQPLAIFVNSMVITGAEPVIVDCGPAVVREQWLEQTFSVVDPVDVRWIYLSHDDADHVGNLGQVLDLCPNATLVTNSFMVERMLADVDYELPLDRMRWVNDGDRFSVGDRELVAVTPPVFDSPTTRGLFDTRTGVYWAADAFACPIPYPVADLAELGDDFWPEPFTAVHALLSPWHQWLDQARYDAHLDRIAGLGIRVAAGAHGPAVRGARVPAALEHLSRLPSLPPLPQPGQPELEAMVAMFAAMGTDVAA